jgi:hypothetical protein
MLRNDRLYHWIFPITHTLPGFAEPGRKTWSFTVFYEKVIKIKENYFCIDQGRSPEK